MDPLVVEAGELDAEQILDELEAGRRVVVEIQFLGEPHEVTLRYDDVWYCDTPTRLHKHETREAMRRCLEKQGHVPSDTQ